MKQYKKILFLLLIFIIVLGIILFVFGGRYERILIKSKTDKLVEAISSLKEGTYYYKNGVLYDSENNIVDTSVYIEMEGNVTIDKYGYSEIKIKNDKYFSCKTSLGNTIVSKKCNISKIDVGYSKNNNIIAFSFNKKIDSYYISKTNELKNDFTSVSYKDNLILPLEGRGSYYAWFKDEFGNVSKSIFFNVECLLAEDSMYDKRILYCPGSIVEIDGSDWMVINDKNKVLDIMQLDALDNKMAHSEKDIEYRWSLSLINKYLNSEYYKSLPDIIKNNIIEKEICDDVPYTAGCDSEDGCGGYKKETIEREKWTCNTYSKSKVRLISFDEYNVLYKVTNDTRVISDNYWSLNSSRNTNESMSILDSGKVYIYEKITNKLNIKPVVTILK